MIRFTSAVMLRPSAMMPLSFSGASTPVTCPLACVF